MNSSDINTPRTIDNTTGNVLPTRTKRIDLATIVDCRKELATVYRLMRNGDIESAMGTTSGAKAPTALPTVPQK